MPLSELIGWSVLSGVFGFLALLVLITRIQYRVSVRGLVITFLGIPVRRIPFSDFVKITKRKTAWAENWKNCVRGSHRQLVIHRRCGWIRQIVITPKQRYVFRKQLEDGWKGASPEA